MGERLAPVNFISIALTLTVCKDWGWTLGDNRTHLLILGGGRETQPYQNGVTLTLSGT